MRSEGHALELKRSRNPVRLEFHLIIFNREVLFVHNPKTAGTSMLRWLSSVLPSAQTVGIRELGTHHPHLSMALGYACGRTGNQPGDFKRILAVVRDPVDRERSMYSHFQSLATRPDTPEHLKDELMLRRVHLAAQLEFDEYMRTLDRELGHCDVWQSRWFYFAMDGERLPNSQVLRFSKLDEDLSAALRDVELTSEPPLPHLNRSDSANVSVDGWSEHFILKSYRWMEDDGLLDPL